MSAAATTKEDAPPATVKAHDDAALPEETRMNMEIVCPAGVDARSKIYRRGNEHFEIDSPAAGWSWRYALLRLLAMLGSLTGLGVGFGRALAETIDGDTWWLFMVIPFGLIFTLVMILTVYDVIRLRATHQNLVITATEFHIKRTYATKRDAKDSVNHPERAAEPLTWKDRLFCSQESGMRSDLTEAQIAEYQCCKTTWYTLHLNADSRKYCVEKEFTQPERDWLHEQINSFLKSTNSAQS